VCHAACDDRGGRTPAPPPDSATQNLTAVVLRQTVEDGTEWGEWEQRGTVVDGSPDLVRGVVIFTVASELVQSASAYRLPARVRMSPA
jgi:hypothetical protein